MQRVLYGLMLLGILCACGDRLAPTTPSLPVWLELPLQSHTSLLSPGGMERITQARLAHDRLGFAGVLVVRSLTDEAFFAYDLACPYEMSPSVQLVQDDLQVRCPECGGQYDVLSGSGAPISGPSRSPLRPYRTQYISSTRVVRVVN